MAEDFKYGIKSLETELPLLIFPFMFSTIHVSETIRKRVSKVYAITMILTIVYGFWQLAVYFKTTSPYGFWEYTQFHLDPAWFWEHSRHFAQSMLTWDWIHYSFINISIIYGLHLLVYLDNRAIWDRILLTVYVVLAVLFLIYTGSRIGLFAFAIAIVSYITFSFEVVFVRSRISFLLILSLIIGVIIILVLWGNEIDAIRYHYWSRAVESIKLSPFIGHGTGATRLVMTEPEFEAITGWSVNHPHNQYLSELVQFGVVGSLPLFAFMIYGIRHSLQNRDMRTLCLIITGMVFMITESPLNSNKGIVPFILLVCLSVKKTETKLRKSTD